MFSNIFVLCTGRCGSTTFVKACKHLSNYTAGHETRTGLIGRERFAYPAFHIEADNRLSWLLGRLDKIYGNSAFYVHLTRDPEDTAASYAKRKGGIMAAYQGMGILMKCKEKNARVVARDYVDTVNTSIEFFLSDKSHKMLFQIERAKDDFERFAHLVGARGDLKSALKEFDVMHNASKQKV